MRPVKLGIALCGMMICGGMPTQAVPIGTVVLTVDERGEGLVDFGHGDVAFQGVLAPDPGPGGLQSALTFGLVGLSFPGEPPLTAGDVLIRDGATGVLLDILRFNPSGTGGVPDYIPSLVFYSIDPESDRLDLADTPTPPSSFYENTLTVLEDETEGPITFSYDPLPGQPGFVPGFTVTYGVVPQVPEVPEPPGMAIFAVALAYLAVIRRKADWIGQQSAPYFALAAHG
jgi:hypothetical protein